LRFSSREGTEDSWCDGEREEEREEKEEEREEADEARERLEGREREIERERERMMHMISSADQLFRQ
jgi:hypothetical protein